MSHLVQYRRKEKDREISWGIGNRAAPIIICLLLSLLVVVLVMIGVSPAEIWQIEKHLKWR